MPDLIATATTVAIDPETLEVNDAYPGTYGFYVRLSRDPGPEWAVEFDAAYTAAPHPIHPPVVFRGDTLCVFYLPIYQDALPDFLAHLERVVSDTNASVEKRNRALPDDTGIRESFRTHLSAVAEQFQTRR
jgi:hypothetical protein